MRSILLSPVSLVLGALAACAAACGTSVSSSPSALPDAGPVASPPLDAGGDDASPGVVDAGMTDAATADAGVDAASLPPAPTDPRLLVAEPATVLATTADGYAIYGTNSGVFAVSLQGGSPITIDAPLGPNVVVVGPVALLYPGSVGAVHSVTVWSAAGGTHTVSALEVGVLADGSRIAYHDLTGGSLIECDPDLSNAITLESPEGCGDVFSAGAYILTTNCVPPPDDGGATPSSVDLWDAHGVRTHLFPEGIGPNVLVAWDGRSVVAESSPESDGHTRLRASPLTGGPSTVIADVADGGLQLEAVTPDGARVVWEQANAGIGNVYQYQSSPIASPGPTALATLPNGASIFTGFSPDGQWFLDRSVASTSSFTFTALSTSSAAESFVMVPTDFAADVFTQDSQYVVGGTVNAGGGADWGVFVESLAGGAVTTVSPHGGQGLPYSGSRFVYLDYGADASTTLSSGTLTAADAAHPGATTPIDQATPGFVLDPAGAGIVYTRTSGGQGTGVYYVALP